jgi:hypothetical protein
MKCTYFIKDHRSHLLLETAKSVWVFNHHLSEWNKDSIYESPLPPNEQHELFRLYIKPAGKRDGKLTVFATLYNEKSLVAFSNTFFLKDILRLLRSIDLSPRELLEAYLSHLMETNYHIQETDLSHFQSSGLPELAEYKEDHHD